MGKTEKRSPLIRKIAVLLAVAAIAVFPLTELLYKADVIAYSPSYSLLSALGFSDNEEDKEYVEFLSVGQGDSTLVRSSGKALLIDFGLQDESSQLYWDLKERRVEKVDLALITHGHKDHLGGFLDLAENMKIESLIISPDVAENSDKDEYNKVIEYAKKSGIKLYAPNVGDRYTVGSAELQILYVGDSKAEENNRSVISSVTLGGRKILFMGDTEGENENDFLFKTKDVSADIIKLGHHGSYTATGYELIKRINAKIAVASCGYNNTYGHPSEKVLKRLSENNIACYRTDLDGDIRCEMGDNGFTVFTERKEK